MCVCVRVFVRLCVCFTRYQVCYQVCMCVLICTRSVCIAECLPAAAAARCELHRARAANRAASKQTFFVTFVVQRKRRAPYTQLQLAPAHPAMNNPHNAEHWCNGCVAEPSDRIVMRTALSGLIVTIIGVGVDVDVVDLSNGMHEVGN